MVFFPSLCSSVIKLASVTVSLNYQYNDLILFFCYLFFTVFPFHLLMFNIKLSLTAQIPSHPSTNRLIWEKRGQRQTLRDHSLISGSRIQRELTPFCRRKIEEQLVGGSWEFHVVSVCQTDSLSCLTLGLANKTRFKFS